MKVQNMTSRKGNPIPNQFRIHMVEKYLINGKEQERAVTYFQSYNSIIVKQYFHVDRYVVELDRNKWDYSTTTSKYRNQFLDESKAETEAKIKSGEYILADLN